MNEPAEIPRTKFECEPCRLFATRVVALLRKFEFVSTGCGRYCDGQGGDFCPSCLIERPRHEPDCELAAMIRECEGA